MVNTFRQNIFIRHTQQITHKYTHARTFVSSINSYRLKQWKWNRYRNFTKYTSNVSQRQRMRILIPFSVKEKKIQSNYNIQFVCWLFSYSSSSFLFVISKKYFLALSMKNICWFLLFCSLKSTFQLNANINFRYNDGFNERKLHHHFTSQVNLLYGHVSMAVCTNVHANTVRALSVCLVCLILVGLIRIQSQHRRHTYTHVSCSSFSWDIHKP